MKQPRRSFFKQSALAFGAATFVPSLFSIGRSRSPYERTVGHGEFRYRVHKEWGTQDPTRIPVKNCHEMVQDRQGRLILLTDAVQNNVIIYDKSGKVIHTWTGRFPGAHGLTLADENDEQFLFITDSETHQVYKTTLDGKVVMTLTYPKEIPAYESEEQYKPTEVAVAPNGDFYVADGYGLDFVIQYSPKGEYIRHFAGKGDAEDQLNNAHGVCLDTRQPDNPQLLVTSRARQEFKQFSLEGQYLDTIKIPGADICRPVISGDELYFAVIASKSWWQYDGFVVVLDKNNQVVSAPGGSAPTYQNGQLQPMVTDDVTFMNPHDVCVDDEQNLYVPQWYSGKTYPVKLARLS